MPGCDGSVTKYPRSGTSRAGYETFQNYDIRLLSQDNVICSFFKISQKPWRPYLDSSLPEDLFTAQGPGHAHHCVLRGEVTGGGGGEGGGGGGRDGGRSGGGGRRGVNTGCNLRHL